MSKPTVVVVGGGIAGAATAFALAQEQAEVTVIDNAHAGQATAAGAGILEPWSSGLEGPAYDLYAAGAAYYPTLLAALDHVGVTDVSYHVAGCMIVDADSAALDAVEVRVRRRTTGVAVAGEVTRLGEHEAHQMVPALAPGLQGVHIAGGARVDGRRLRAGLLDAARRLGADVRTGDARVALDAHGSCVVRVDDEVLGPDAVVVAAGAWTNHVLQPLGYSVPVAPQRGQLIHLHIDGVDTTSWPTVLPLADNYIVPFEAGRIVIGATRESGSGFDARTTAGGLREVLESALAIAPGLASATVLETRVGLRPLTDSEAPYVGPVAAVPRLFVNAGFGPAGLTMGPVVGAALASTILGELPQINLSPFVPPAPRD